MKFACRFAGLLFFLWLAACQAPEAPPAVLQEFSFDTPCSELPRFFSDRNIQSRGDPTGSMQQITVFVEHPLFRVAEIRCARLIASDGEAQPFPVEVTFFSGGKDENGRITKASVSLDDLLNGAYKEKPTKRFTTARWDSSEWSGGPLRVREYESSPSNTKALRIIFSRYPNNSAESLNAHMSAFLEILKNDPLAPPPSESM